MDWRIAKLGRRRHRTATGLTLLALFAWAGSTLPSMAGDLKTDDDVSIAIGNEPPFTELKPDGTVTGAGPDIDKAALELSGFKKFTGQIIAYGAMIPALQAGRVSMVSSGGLIVLPERCEKVVFSEPVICNSQALMVRGEMAGKFKSYKDAADSNIKLAVPGGGIQEKKALAAGVKRENLVSYPDPTSAMKMLQDKRVDAIALNDTALLDLRKKSGDETLEVIFPLADVPVDCGAAAFAKKDIALRDAYNVGLKKLVDSGEFDRIMAKYGLESNAKLRAAAKTTAEMCQGN
ncbi:ectoine/hydroxyectoine ABC transporter substrate-binding protein EhuB [Mesorhizobium sp. PL10]